MCAASASSATMRCSAARSCESSTPFACSAVSYLDCSCAQRGACLCVNGPRGCMPMGRSKAGEWTRTGGPGQRGRQERGAGRGR
jgi:hypothetical protein